MIVCKRCKTAPATLTAYWGDPLCGLCAPTVATLLDEHDHWPEVPWGDDEEVLLDG